MKPIKRGGFLGTVLTYLLSIFITYWTVNEMRFSPNCIEITGTFAYFWCWLVLKVLVQYLLTRSIRDSVTSIDFVQGPPGSRRERVKTPGSRRERVKTPGRLVIYSGISHYMQYVTHVCLSALAYLSTLHVGLFKHKTYLISCRYLHRIH